MSLYQWIRFLPASTAHSLAGAALSIYSSWQTPGTFEWSPLSWKNLRFKNPLGIAGGVDKNASLLGVWKKIGPGFVEIGTVTPRPQKANSGKIVDRQWTDRILWNRMGFPSHGADEVFYNLQKEKADYELPVFVNIGKNRETPNSQAADDYFFLMTRLDQVADAFVINISSPNTTGLRDLQDREFLQRLIQTGRKISRKPMLVKLSPDMNSEHFENLVKECADLGFDGFVLTNTTLSRPKESHFPEAGGLSGSFLKEKSEQILKQTIQILGPRRKDFLLVSVGGILTPEDVKHRLAMGADLVQCYSALVFEGPTFFQHVAQFMTGQRKAALHG